MTLVPPRLGPHGQHRSDVTRHQGAHSVHRYVPSTLHAMYMQSIDGVSTTRARKPDALGGSILGSAPATGPGKDAQGVDPLG
jgi:hypothetical protein